MNTTMTTITGKYTAHYERGIQSKLTNYADTRDVRVSGGSFKAVLNPALPITTINEITLALESVWHVTDITISR